MCIETRLILDDPVFVLVVCSHINKILSLFSPKKKKRAVILIGEERDIRWGGGRVAIFLFSFLYFSFLSFLDFKC